MTPLDTSESWRLPILMEMVGNLSRAANPHEVLQGFSAGLVKLQGPRGYVSLSTRGLAPGEFRITRMLLDENVAHIDTGDPWRDGHRLPVHDSGFFSELIRQAYPQIVHNFNLRDDPVVGDELKHFGSLMAIPLFDNGEPLNWAITLKRDPTAHTVENLEDAILRTNLVGTTVRSVLAADELRKAHERIRREVDRIARIQQALLPERLPDIPGLSLGVSFETFDTAGGDLYDLTPLGRHPDGTRDPNGPWDIHIADASGHGPAAATIVAMLNAMLRAAPADRGPGDLLRQANHHLFTKRVEGTFVTAILARYDPPSRRLTYARAGHNPALHMMRDPKSGEITIKRLDEVGGLPLGVVGDVTYEEATVQLRPGQTVVLYTDGITEATSPDGRQFEVDGIERSLTECSGEPECVITHITDALAKHQDGERPADDQTLLIINVQG